MAADASRSSGPADSYIGSVISLTSKSEIRYEGVLFTINTEEASIGLRNVRSFGTEGRRKDGPQVPPIDKVYEYIVFRGSDIKDLQVKSSPPIQTPSIHNDPAIIQSQYSQAPTSASLPHVSNAAALNVSTRASQSGLPRAPFQSSLPLYQPGGNVSSWNSSAVPPTSGPMMPMYQHGFYGATSNLQSQQPSMLQPPQSLPMPSSAQQPVHNSILNASVQAGLPVSQPMFLQPPSSGGFNVQPSMTPGQSVAVPPADTSMNILPSMTLTQAPLPMSQNLGLPLVSPVSNAMDLHVINTVTKQINSVSGPMTSYNGMPEPVSTAVGSSISPTLVTPGQFVQPGSATVSASQPLQTAHKDVELVQVSSSVQMQPPALSASASVTSAAVPKSTEPQAPLLPLPSPANREFDGAALHNRYIHRGRRGRGRGSELLNSATRFTEDFDFEAMNEKFNKDEVWGHLGKAKVDDNEDTQYDDKDVEFPQFEAKPVYNKDDFFDSLSSNSHDNGSRNGRPRFSEQRRLDTETFGEFSRYRGGRGGRGPGGYGGRFQRGGYYGRGGYGNAGYGNAGYGHAGYGYAGRGRGQYNNNSVYRAT